MNKWQLHASLKADPVKQYRSDESIFVNFTAINIEKELSAQGEVLRKKTTYVDCVWLSPNQEMLQQLRKDSFVYLEGKPYLRTGHRQDGSETHSLAMTVESVQYIRQVSSRPEGASGAPTIDSGLPEPTS